MEVNIKNISSIKESNIVVQYGELQLIQTRAEARAFYSALESLSKLDQKVDNEIFKYGKGLPLEITKDKIERAIIQRTFEDSFYGQINSLFDDSVGEITVDFGNNTKLFDDSVGEITVDFGNNTKPTKFLVKDDIVMVENIKPFNRNVIYIREYNPHDKNIREYMKRRGPIVDIILNQETFGGILYKADVGGMHFVTDENGNFRVNMPGIRDYLHVKNISEDKLAFIILKHLIYHNSDLLMGGILIVEQPNVSKKRLNITFMLKMFQKINWHS